MEATNQEQLPRTPPEIWLRVILAVVLAALMCVQATLTADLREAIKEAHSLQRSEVRELNKLRELRQIEERRGGYDNDPRVARKEE
jgi:hypothetical protein